MVSLFLSDMQIGLMKVIRSQPSIRGILTATSSIAVTLGFFIVFFLGSMTAWREVASVCVFVPIVAMILICFVSFNPVVLLGSLSDFSADS